MICAVRKIWGHRTHYIPSRACINSTCFLSKLGARDKSEMSHTVWISYIIPTDFLSLSLWPTLTLLFCSKQSSTMLENLGFFFWSEAPTGRHSSPFIFQAIHFLPFLSTLSGSTHSHSTRVIFPPTKRPFKAWHHLDGRPVKLKDWPVAQCGDTPPTFLGLSISGRLCDGMPTNLSACSQQDPPLPTRQSVNHSERAALSSKRTEPERFKNPAALFLQKLGEFPPKQNKAQKMLWELYLHKCVIDLVLVRL